MEKFVIISIEENNLILDGYALVVKANRVEKLSGLVQLSTTFGREYYIYPMSENSDTEIFIIPYSDNILKELLYRAKRKDAESFWEPNMSYFEDSRLRLKDGTIKKVHISLEFREKRSFERDIQKMVDNTTTHKINLTDFQVYVDENASFSEQLAMIARNVNWCFTVGNKKGLSDSIVELYNRVHGYNSHKLKTLEAKDGQVVGLAFIKIVLFYNNGDYRVNEIAAQNAYYSIAKNFMETNNAYALPAMFTLFYKEPLALGDELYRINPNPELVGLNGMLPSAIYSKRERALSNRLPIMKYILQQFYDENKKEFKMDVTLPYHIPSVVEIDKFLEEYSKSIYYNNINVLSIGAEYFKRLFEDIEDQLDL